jgi:uncharacterized protein (TIGR03435 family)
MRLRRTCIFVAVLLPLTTPQLRAQAAGNGANQPDGAGIAAADSFGSSAPREVMGPGPGPKGFFGPVTRRPKAGDPALDIVYTKVLHSPGSSADPAPWTSANFSGRVTVITFLPDTTDNLQAVTRWNALVKQFSNQPVEFVWLTGEKESSLLPWLAEHPVEGWVLLDAEGETGRAYGLEMPETVIIGTDRNIVGFDEGMEPTKEVLHAALEGRIRTQPVKPDPAAMEASLKSGMVLLNAEPRRMPGLEDHKPKFPASYDIHIAPSTENGTSSASGGDYWSVRGFSLKMLIAETYDLGMEPGRIDFPDASAAEKRYDVALVLPEEESHNAMMHRVREALQEKFNLTITAETRATEVYVVTAPKGPGPSLHPVKSPGGGFGGSSEVAFEWKSTDGRPPTAKDLQELMEKEKASSGISVSSISVDGGSIADFCRALEDGLDRPVVDETHLTGRYDFEVNRGDHTQDDFFETLAVHLGLVVTPGVRNVSVVVVRQN